jgi:2-haloacid dehalogenase
VARPKVILFDVNETLLDLRPMTEGIGKLLGAGPEAARLWFTTLLQHSLVATVAGKYLDFAEVGAACLRMVAASHGVELSEDAAREAVAPMRSLPPHGDVAPALGRLRDAGFRLFTLTNNSKSAVADQVKNAGLTDYFEALLSVDDVEKYKPHAEVYRWAADRVGADVSGCLLVAAHGWDVAGAKWAGMQSAFVARPGQQAFPLGPTPDITIPSLAELAGELERR